MYLYQLNAGTVDIDQPAQLYIYLCIYTDLKLNAWEAVEHLWQSYPNFSTAPAPRPDVVGKEIK